MVLPFVREVFADVEKSAALARAASHLKSGAGGMSVSGLTPTAKSLFISLLHRAAARPLIVVVPHNRAAEAMLPVVQAFAELTGAAGSGGAGAVGRRAGGPLGRESNRPAVSMAVAARLAMFSSRFWASAS